MDNESRITGGYCIEIWKESGCKIGHKPVDRFVSIRDSDTDKPGNPDMVSYPLSNLMAVTFFAMLGGAESFEDVEVMCTCKQKYFRRFLPLKDGIPAYGMFSRVFSLVDMDFFGEAQVASIMKHLVRLCKRLGIPEPVTREQEEETKSSSQKSDSAGKLRRFLQNLHVSPSNNGIILRSSKIKANNALMIQSMLSPMDLRRTMVSFEVKSAQGIATIGTILGG